VIISRWFTRCWGFVVPQVLGVWMVDLAEVGFGFTGYYGVNRHGYREDWGCFSYRLSGDGGFLPSPSRRSPWCRSPQWLANGLKLMWVRGGDRGHENYNHRVMTFRSSIIERIALKAPLYSIRVGYVNPKGTTNSTEHDELMKRYGLNRHTASAYLIALRGLRHQ